MFILHMLGWRDSVTSCDPASSLLTMNRHRNVALKHSPLVIISEGIAAKAFSTLSQKKILTCFLLFQSLHRTPEYFYFVKVFGGSNPQLKDKEKSPRSEDLRLFSWLGWRDSNPRMSAPKTDALPLGDSPL